MYARSFGFRYAYPQSWLISGLVIAGLLFAANWTNAALVQATASYESIPILPLALLWCSMPQLTWSTIVLAMLRPFGRATFQAIVSCIFAEAILQALSAIPMIQVIKYGREHDFYSLGMKKLDASPAARYMYAGAAVWLIVIIVTSILSLQTAHRLIARPESHTSTLSTPTATKDSKNLFHDKWISFEERMARYWLRSNCDLEESPLLHGDSQPQAVYGTLPKDVHDDHTTESERGVVRLTFIAATSMILLWITQWMFWTGFISLSSEE